MDPKKIMVTGVGANPGFDLARSLTRLGHQVVATDASPLAQGLLLPEVTARVTPLATDPAYAETILQLCKELSVDAVVACIENDLAPLLGLREQLLDAGVAIWLPDDESVHTCVDKLAFAQALAAAGIPTPRCIPLDEVPDGVELVVKPRRGHGAQNVYFCRSREQARVLSELMPEALVQERLYGQEFTADCLVDRDGRASAVLRRRDSIKAGLAAVSSTFVDDTVSDLVQATLRAVRAEGLCCVQGFIHADGAVTMTELNVRVAGGFALSEAAGADLVGQMVNGLFGGPVDHDRLAYVPGLFLSKYVETLAVGEVSKLPTRPTETRTPA